jgi:hypothetical protein
MFHSECLAWTPHALFQGLRERLVPRATLAVIVFKLMVINGLKSVNDAVLTMYKPAAGRITLNENEPGWHEGSRIRGLDPQLCTRKNG